jgi:hypothetical protein
MVRQAHHEGIIARIEVGSEGPDTRFVVTNLTRRNARALYEDLYCRRGQAENHIKSFKTHLAADRSSCTKATANEFRLFLHAGAYWLMWGLRKRWVTLCRMTTGYRQSRGSLVVAPGAVEIGFRRPTSRMRRLVSRLLAVQHHKCGVIAFDEEVIRTRPGGPASAKNDSLTRGRGPKRGLRLAIHLSRQSATGIGITCARKRQRRGHGYRQGCSFL